LLGASGKTLVKLMAGSIWLEGGIPLCFASGYDASLMVPPKLRDRKMLNKPYSRADLATTLTELPGR